MKFFDFFFFCNFCIYFSDTSQLPLKHLPVLVISTALNHRSSIYQMKALKDLYNVFSILSSVKKTPRVTRTLLHHLPTVAEQ